MMRRNVYTADDRVRSLINLFYEYIYGLHLTLSVEFTNKMQSNDVLSLGQN